MPPAPLRHRIALACLIGLALLLAGLVAARAWTSSVAWTSRCDIAETDAVRRASVRQIERGAGYGFSGTIERLEQEADYRAWLRDRYFFEPATLPDRNAFLRRWYREPGLRRKRPRRF